MVAELGSCDMVCKALNIYCLSLYRKVGQPLIEMISKPIFILAPSVLTWPSSLFHLHNPRPSKPGFSDCSFEPCKCILYRKSIILGL